MTNYDILIIGGGIGGSAMAKVLAEHGAKVLVLESETRFHDRVRGEWIAPWGVAEAKKLGIYHTLLAAGGHELRYLAGDEPRDFKTTTRCGEPSLSFYHPLIQEALLEEAGRAGAEIRRGAKAHVRIENGTPIVDAEVGGIQTEVRARLVVGADGRNSSTRHRAGFNSCEDSDHFQVAGLLFDDMPVPETLMHTWLGTWHDIPSALFTLLFPQGDGRVRGYVCYLNSSDYRLSGHTSIPQFIELFIQSGAPPEYFASAKAIGPLATFRGADLWVDHPYRSGVALIGDAAAASDPGHGQGLSLTLRDVCVLSEHLLAREDWDKAAHAYAEEHDRYYGVIHTFGSWAKQALFMVGPEGEAVRTRCLAAWQEEPSRNPDVLYSGPDCELDETPRRRLFAIE